MKIATWQSADAPPSQRWIARFLDGKRFLPTFISAATEDGVIQAAQAFWDSEVERLSLRKGRKPATVADAIIERQGKPDPVEKGIRSADTPASIDTEIEDLLA